MPVGVGLVDPADDSVAVDEQGGRKRDVTAVHPCALVTDAERVE